MGKQTQLIRALLVDDHSLFRESVARVLAMEPDLEVEHCASILEALNLMAQRTFDLVLLDHDLGGERASQFLPAARQAGYEGRVLVVTAWVSETEARRLMRQGVSGIFLKEAPLRDLSTSIRTVMAAGTWLDASLTHMEPDAATRGETSPPPFNDPQRKASANLRKLCEGHSTRIVSEDRRADTRPAGPSGLRTVRRPIVKRLSERYLPGNSRVSYCRPIRRTSDPATEA